MWAFAVFAIDLVAALVLTRVAVREFALKVGETGVVTTIHDHPGRHGDKEPIAATRAGEFSERDEVRVAYFCAPDNFARLVPFTKELGVMGTNVARITGAVTHHLPHGGMEQSLFEATLQESLLV